MTYEQKNNELQKIFKEKFDVYEKYKRYSSPLNKKFNEYKNAKSEFEKANMDLQEFLILFKGNNASPDEEFGTEGQRCN